MTITPEQLQTMRSDARAALTLSDDLSVAARSPLTASFACYEQCDDWTVDAGPGDPVAVFSYGEGDARFFVGAVASVPAMAGHVVTLAEEVEQLRARVAAWRAHQLAALDYVPHPASIEDRCALEKRREAAETPPPAWTCTTCDTSGTAADLADDGAGPVCPECRQARHLCMHGPTAHLGAPSPLDRVVAEVVAVDVDLLALCGTTTPTMSQALEAIRGVVFDTFVHGQHPAQVKLATAIGLRAIAGIQACDAPATAAKAGPS